MSYHEAFWGVVGTAAPVIALANIVAVSDSLFLLRTFRPPRKAMERHAWRFGLGRRGRRISRLAYWIAGLIVLSQAVALLLALESLAKTRDQFPPTVMAIIEASVLAGVMLTGILTVRARWVQHSIEEERADKA